MPSIYPHKHVPYSGTNMARLVLHDFVRTHPFAVSAECGTPPNPGHTGQGSLQSPLPMHSSPSTPPPAVFTDGESRRVASLGPRTEFAGLTWPLSSKLGTRKTVKATFGPSLAGNIYHTLVSCALFARKRLMGSYSRLTDFCITQL